MNTFFEFVYEKKVLKAKTDERFLTLNISTETFEFSPC